MIEVNFQERQEKKDIAGLWQYDHGRSLLIKGLNLPDLVEVHFSLEEKSGESLKVTGVTEKGVTKVEIPDVFLDHDGHTGNYAIYAYIYLDDGAKGQTVRQITVRVRGRTKPGDYAGANESKDYIPTQVKKNENDIKTLFDSLKEYLKVKGGQLTGKLITRDVYVGGEIDENGTYHPEGGQGKSSLRVSGTLMLFGQVFAEASSFAIKALKVLSEVTIGGSLTVENATRIKNSLRVDSELRVDGRLKVDGTLDMKRNDIKNVESLEVEGTANLSNDVYVRNKANREGYNKYKLADALEEALEGTFKNRYVSGKFGGTTFAEQLQATIDACPEGGAVYLSSGEYELEKNVDISKSITILCSLKKANIHYTGKGEAFRISSGQAVILRDLTFTNNTGAAFASASNLEELNLERCDLGGEILAENVNSICVKECRLAGICDTDSDTCEAVAEKSVFEFGTYALGINGKVKATDCEFEPKEGCISVFKKDTSVVGINCRFNQSILGTEKATLMGCDTDTVLGKDDLENAVNMALAEAKEAGTFDGEKGEKGDPGEKGADGYTPVKGTDYFTDQDKSELVSAVLEALPAAEEVAF